MNLTHWPAIVPGVFAAHEIFHFFVIAGTTCHVLFMLGVVIPSPEPASLPRPSSTSGCLQTNPALLSSPFNPRSGSPIFHGERG